MRLVFVLICLTTVIHVAWSAKILGIFALNIKSHSIMINTIVEELLVRGHQVTVYKYLRLILMSYIVVIVGRGYSISIAFKHTQLYSNRYIAGLQLCCRR